MSDFFTITGRTYLIHYMSLSKLRPVENLSQVDKIELRLEEYLKNEHFNPGDALPKEMELAKALGVSRTAVREAISRFKMLGIIESRKNRGMIITQPDILNNMQRVLDPKLLDGETMKDIFEMRLVIEMGLADLVFLRKSDENIAKLEEIARKEEKTTNRIEKLRFDIEFHSILYRMSGNHTMIRFQKMLIPIFDYVNSTLTARKTHVKGVQYANHWDLIHELKEGTANSFRDKMQSHLQPYYEKL